MIKILARESHVITEVSLSINSDKEEMHLNSVYALESHQETDHTGRIIIPRHMVTLYDYWRPYALEEERRKQKENLIETV